MVVVVVIWMPCWIGVVLGCAGVGVVLGLSFPKTYV